MNAAAVYVRVSTSRQAERDLSIPDQIAQCRDWCARRSIEVVEIFSEPGASALDEDRPVFQEMIYKAKRPERPFDVVVVHSLSRFSRDTLHSELYIRELKKAGVELVSITQDVGQDSTGELVRKMLHVFDEHQSRETAKHTRRAMCENARQGFWNGSSPPYGYKVEVKERRGDKDKKVLVPNEVEAAVVRQIFDLASGTSGRPMGVKNIAVYLNDRGLRRKGYRWSTGSVHVILSTTTYRGLHYFNKRDSRKRVPRPQSQWIATEVPALVDERTFDVVQGLLKSRDPKRMPPRVANGPTLLAGIARCGHCGAALIQNTGKSGAYRYYCCSKRLKEGAHDCKGLRMRMDALDGMVLGEVAKIILEPGRLTELLEGYMKSSAERSEAAQAQLANVRHAHKEAEAAIARLLGLVEQGLMDAGDPALRDRLMGLRLQRDELAREVAEQQKRLATGTRALTPEKIRAVGILLRDKLFEGPPELRQAYARLLLSEVAVTREEIMIIGSKSALARCASTELGDAAPAVLSFVQKWRPRQDSNL
jgi:site-specific DNA recombinase